MAGRKGGFPGRESKKPKQNAKKTKGVGSLLSTPSTATEVVRKKRAPKESDTDKSEEA